MMKTVRFVFSENDRETASRIAGELSQQFGTYNSDDDNKDLTFSSDKGIFEDSAVVIISLQAIDDEKWKKEIDALDAGIRLIPVSLGLGNDREIYERIPKRIIEINFIGNSDGTVKKIAGSLAQDNKLYEIKSSLLRAAESWKMTDRSSAFLLSSRKQIKSHRKIIEEARLSEDDEGLRSQLDDISDYLSESGRYARRLAFRKFLRGLKIGVLGLLAAGVIVMLAVVLPFLTRSKYAAAVVSVESTEELAPVQAMKMLEGITNPFVKIELSKYYYDKLVKYLDMNWQNTPVGINYKWALNDAYLCADERHIRTALGNGHAALWDNLTGEKTEDEAVSSQPLSAIAADSSENFVAASDTEGYIYIRGEKGWTRSDDRFDIPFTKTLSMKCGESFIAVSDGTRIMCFTAEGGSVRQVSENSFEELLCFEVSGQTVTAAFTENGQAVTAKINGGSLENKTVTDVKTGSVKAADMKDGRLAVIDESGCLCLLNAGESRPERTGITLRKAERLCLINDRTILCYSRDTGSHIYDTVIGADLGKVLNEAAAPFKVSSRGTTVMLDSNNCFYSEDVKALLPAEVPSGEGVKVSDQTSAASQGTVRSAKISDEYLVILDLYVNNSINKVLLDPCSRFFIGDAQLGNFPKEYADYSYYSEIPFSFSGRPTVTDITEDGSVLLLGAEDGTFCEIGFTDNGSCTLTSCTRAASHLPITKIYSTDECYIIQDSAGTCFRARKGSSTLTWNGMYEAVKNKLKMSFEDGIKDVVSQKVLDATGARVLPYSSGERWE